MWHCGKCHCVLFLQTRAHSHVKKEVQSRSTRAKAGWGPRKLRGFDSQAVRLCESLKGFARMYVYTGPSPIAGVAYQDPPRIGKNREVEAR